MSVRIVCSLLSLLIPFATTLARTITVPRDVPTIQAGFDSIGVGDTLFIETGVYRELLVAPAFPFVMIGELLTDSTGTELPMIDGSDVEGPDSSATLVLPLNSAVSIRALTFKNLGRTGIASWADRVHLSNCEFERMEDGFWHRADSAGSEISIDSCRFRELDLTCVIVRIGSSLTAYRCHFGGMPTVELPLVIAGTSSINYCEFSGDRPLLGCFDGASSITHCVFGPGILAPSHAAVWLAGDATEFSHNTFIDIVYGYHALYVNSSVGDSVRITNNTFARCTGVENDFSAQGAMGTATPFVQGQGALIADNVFVECSGFMAADCIVSSAGSPAQIVRNQFLNDSLNGVPSISAGNPEWQASPVTLSENRFINCGYAADLGITADARFNYWGDITGPYHATRNPFGLGDTITGDVPFVPWLEDTISGVDGSRPEVADDMQLFLYPNPFNATVTIEYALTREQDVTLEIFDVLGRQVERLLNERQGAGMHSVKWDAEGYASGSYFARLTLPAAHRSSKAVKLLLVR